MFSNLFLSEDGYPHLPRKHQMQTFIGTKIIKAVPLTRAEYNAYRSWDMPSDEVGTDEGYLVEYTDGGKPNDSRHEGYISWSPKEQFDNAYRQCSGMSFGLAIEAMKKGHNVARTGWNGTGMFAYYVPAASHSVSTYRAYMVLKATDGTFVPWAPSCSDALADDWMIV